MNKRLRLHKFKQLRHLYVHEFHNIKQVVRHILVQRLNVQLLQLHKVNNE